jgi:hypothetical protein
MSEEEDLVITARVLPENREVYETLISMSLQSGLTVDEVNTQLFNAGLFQWVSRVSTGLADGPEPEVGNDDGEEDPIEKS